MRKALGSLLASAMVALPIAAMADNIYNTIDASIDTTLEVINLSAGGATGSTQYKVQIADGDGKNGCNFQGSESITVSVNTSNASVATVSPTSLTFASCSDTKTVTITPLAVGTSNITLAQTANTTGDTFSYTQASFTVNVSAAVPVDITAPVIAYSLSAPANGNGWHKADVFVDWTVTDAESAAVLTGCVDTLVSAEGTTTLNCSATSLGGTSSDSVTIKLDKTAPTAALAVTAGTAGTNGWYVSDVTVDTSGTDALSGIDTCTADQFLTTDSAGTEFNGSCTDLAGNTTNATPLTVKLDKTAPTINAVIDAPNDNGWYNEETPVVFNCADATSGIALVDGCSEQYLFMEGQNQSRTGTAVDNAGNTATVTVSDIDVDMTKPVITPFIYGTAGTNGWYVSAVDIEFECDDNNLGSGIETDTVDEDNETLGDGADQDVTSDGDCVDFAGNEADPVTVEDIDVDATAPTAELTVTDGDLGDDGWYVTDVTVSTTGEDETSGIAECTADQFQTTDTTGEEFNGSCTDEAGNVGEAEPLTVKLDKTAPTISGAATTAANGNGWYKTAVTVDFTCNDVTSGVQTDTIPNETLSSEGAGQTATSQLTDCEDNAGNVATVAGSVSGINIDLTAPVVTITTPADEAAFLQLSTVNADWAVSDALSGIDGALTTATTADGALISTAATGAFTYTVSATDLAGNTTSVTNDYTVFTYVFSGLKAPINLTAKEFKQTSTIPVKFQILNSVTGLPVQGPVATLKVNGVNAVSSGGSNVGNTFRYDATAKQYIFNLSTKGLLTGTNTLTIDFSTSVPTQQVKVIVLK